MRTIRHEILELHIEGTGQDETGPFVLVRQRFQSADGKSGTVEPSRKVRPGETLQYRAGIKASAQIETYVADEES